MNKLNTFKWLRVALFTLPLVLVAFAVFRTGAYTPTLFEDVINSLHLPISFFTDIFASFFSIAFNTSINGSHALITYMSYIVLVEIALCLVRIPLVVTDVFNWCHNLFKDKIND